MGPEVSVQLERYGFYPAGGGCFAAEIKPVSALQAVEIGERSEITHRKVVAIVANLPSHIAAREVKRALSALNWDEECGSVLATKNSAGPGNVVMIELGTAEVLEIFAGFGELNVSAERVAAGVAKQARDYLASSAVAGEHLADQLLLPMALAGGGSFTAAKLSLHARTNMAVIRQFLPVEFLVQERPSCLQVTVETRRG